MFVVKNACRSLLRNKGRNVLITIIVVIIAMAATVSLAIRSAANSAREEGLANTTVTATIGVDRENALSNAGGDTDSQDAGAETRDVGDSATEQDAGEALSRSDMRDALDIEALTLEDYEYYAEITSVPVNTYYTEQTTVNGTDDFEPVESTTSASSTDTSTSSEDTSENSTESEMGGFGGGEMGQGAASSGDFSLTGFSSDTAVANEANAFTMDEGEVFTYSEDAIGQVIISRNLADFNGLSIGDTITVENVDNESVTYELTIVGIYRTTSVENTVSSGPMGGTSMDSDNAIYTSTVTLESIGLDSQSSASSDSDSASLGTQTQLTFTYVLSNANDYYAFVEEVAAAGLDDNYAVSSTDVEQYESSLVPLNNVANFALTLLCIVLGVGAIVLIVINLFNIRERKYEIGVLLAIGVRKSKVAGQFVVELLIVTMVGILIGVTAGSVSAVPVADYLLAEQVSAASSEEESTLSQFGREADLPGSPDSMADGGAGSPRDQIGKVSDGSTSSDSAADSEDTSEEATDSAAAQSGDTNAAEDVPGGFSQYLDTIDATVNLSVVGQMVLIGLVLTIVSALAGMVSIIRYEPLQILADRS